MAKDYQLVCSVCGSNRFRRTLYTPETETVCGPCLTQALALLRTARRRGLVDGGPPRRMQANPRCVQVNPESDTDHSVVHDETAECAALPRCRPLVDDPRAFESEYLNEPVTNSPAPGGGEALTEISDAGVLADFPPPPAAPYVGRRMRVKLDVPGVPQSAHMVYGRCVHDDGSWLTLITPRGGRPMGPRADFEDVPGEGVLCCTCKYGRQVPSGDFLCLVRAGCAPLPYNHGCNVGEDACPAV